MFKGFPTPKVESPKEKETKYTLAFDAEGKKDSRLGNTEKSNPLPKIHFAIWTYLSVPKLDLLLN